MINAIYGKKVGMTQLFDEDGKIIPVTVIEAAPNKVCQIKTTDTDGYEAVQLGFGTIKENKVNKPMAGHFAKLGTEPVRYLREVRVEDASEHTVGEEVTVANFAEVGKVDVTGTSKGKGFAGVMRRYNFGGGSWWTRCSLPSRTRFNWSVRLSFSCIQGFASPRTYGLRYHYHQEFGSCSR